MVGRRLARRLCLPTPLIGAPALSVVTAAHRSEIWRASIPARAASDVSSCYPRLLESRPAKAIEANGARGFLGKKKPGGLRREHSGFSLKWSVNAGPFSLRKKSLTHGLFATIKREAPAKQKPAPPHTLALGHRPVFWADRATAASGFRRFERSAEERRIGPRIRSRPSHPWGILRQPPRAI